MWKKIYKRKMQNQDSNLEPLRNRSNYTQKTNQVNLTSLVELTQFVVIKHA